MARITLPPTKYGEEDCKIWGSINNHSKFSYLKIVKEILSDSLFSRLKTTFLGPIIKAGLRKEGGNQNGDGLGFSGQLVHFLVVRQIVSSREDEIWFCINNKPMRFSLTEFHLVTGLPCWIKEDEVPIDFECDWPLLLPDKRYRVDDLIAQLKVLGEDDEESKLRLAMLIVVLTIFMLPYGITKYWIPKEFLAMAKKNIHAYPWGKASFDMLVSSVKSFNAEKLQKIDLKGFPMALQLWMLASVSELEEAYARLDNKSDRFPVCARYLSTVQPSYDQIMSKEEDLNVISVLGDSSEEEDDEVLMHLLKTGYVFSELDWKRGYALAQHQEDQEVEISDRDYADVDKTTPNTEANADTEGEADAEEMQMQLQMLNLSFQDDEPSASTALPTAPPKKIIAEVNVLEVVGELDVSKEAENASQSLKNMKLNVSIALLNKTKQLSESVDINGFQVLPAQVESVRRIFEKYPGFASSLHSMNRHLKSTYMNVVLGLIETLCQSPQELSDDDLEEASDAVSFVANGGFRVEWLEKMIQEVKAKKKTIDSGKARLLKMEEELQKHNQKCLELKTLMKTEKLEVLAASVPLSFDGAD